MIDWDRLEALRAEVGDAAFAEIRAMFLDEAGEIMDRLGAGQSASWEADFHALKSSALNMGFTELADLCQAAESRAREGRGGAVDAPAVLSSLRASLVVFEQGATV